MARPEEMMNRSMRIVMKMNVDLFNDRWGVRGWLGFGWAGGGV